ncbi:hypothetical protein [Paenibacillus daejeonensis]|uniref:hypothetical protein n=1 Tax=Paenibacillus daejeonensis TaxID=135193 RepID=UPI000376DC5F|nr:hypothetical protein [Paenibacillus daejeonensis]
MTKIKPGRLAELSIAQWQEWIAEHAQHVRSTPYQQEYGNEVRALVREALPELTAEADWLFDLNIHLFLLRKQSTSGHSSYAAQIAASETIQEVANHLVHGSTLDIAARQWDRLLETTTYIRETAVTHHWSPTAFLDIYVELWIQMIAPKADGNRIFEEELARLNEAEETVLAAEKADSTSLTGSTYGHGPRKTHKLFLLVARAWMQLWLVEDRKAWQLLEIAERHQLQPGHVFRFLSVLEEAGEWHRLEAWLSECATERIGRRPGTLEKYGRYWDAVVERVPEAEDRMWHGIKSQLPYSRSLYEEKLLHYRRWRQWVDYQLSVGSDPLDFRVKDLQPIDKEAPEALLPFYHQGAEKYVLLKNRNGYKRAVKLLKRLAKLYKKLKREERWAAYIETFARRHSRLRALQEELRKGKLIP